MSASHQSLSCVEPSKAKPSPWRVVEWAPSQPSSQSACTVSLLPSALRSTASMPVPLSAKLSIVHAALDLERRAPARHSSSTRSVSLWAIIRA